MDRPVWNQGCAIFCVVCLASSLSAGTTAAARPPKSGMAAPPVYLAEENPLFDPAWVSHRGQVVLFMYVGKDSEIPAETVTRVNDMQTRYAPQGFQAVVMTEAGDASTSFNPEVLVVRDRDGATKNAYEIVEEREYFLVDRYGRLRRQRIRPSFIERALQEYFDPSWIGFSNAWNQSYFVHLGEVLLYIADTVPDTAAPGGRVELRVIALPNFMEPREGSKIFKPIQIEVHADEGFEKDNYKAELNEEVDISTELLVQIGIRPDAEPGFHVLGVNIRHRHCGLGDCGAFNRTIPVPIWIE
jgi:hypothetical protein